MPLTDPRDALLLTMVLASAADGDMSDAEMENIGVQVRFLPAFRGWDLDQFDNVAAECLRLLGQSDGLHDALAAIQEMLPDDMYETAYALACDMVAADGHATQEELRILELMRHELGIGRLQASAIEYGTRARFRAFS